MNVASLQKVELALVESETVDTILQLIVRVLSEQKVVAMERASSKGRAGRKSRASALVWVSGSSAVPESLKPLDHTKRHETDPEHEIERIMNEHN